VKVCAYITRSESSSALFIGKRVPLRDSAVKTSC